MGGSCSAYGERRGVYRVLWGNLRQRGHLEEPGIYGSVILRWIFRKWDVGSMDRIDRAQDRDTWRVRVNALMNLRVPQNMGNFLTS